LVTISVLHTPAHEGDISLVEVKFHVKAQVEAEEHCKNTTITDVLLHTHIHTHTHTSSCQVQGQGDIGVDISAHVAIAIDWCQFLFLLLLLLLPATATKYHVMCIIAIYCCWSVLLVSTYLSHLLWAIT
jgi:hypothetical protein